MKATAESLPVPIVSDKSWPAVYADLVKARLTLLVLATTLVGFYVGSRGPLDLSLHKNTSLLIQLKDQEHWGYVSITMEIF